MLPTGRSRALSNIVEESLDRATRRPLGAEPGLPLDPPKLAEQFAVRVAALALSTSARTIQSPPSRVTDVAPNFATSRRPMALGESELTRASSRSFMAVSSGKG